jgi:hypothetical protein
VFGVPRRLVAAIRHGRRQADEAVAAQLLQQSLA